MAVLAICTGCTTNDPSLARHTLEVGHTTASYELFVPTTPLQPAPVVVALHRFTENGAQMARVTGFNHIAEREGFLVIYPNGPGRRFEAWDSETRDDVALVLAILGDVGQRARIDSSRVYVIGASNGGFLVHRLACLAPNVFAAAASVMALMPRTLAEQVPDGMPVPMLIIHGTDDRIVPGDATSVFAGSTYEVLPIAETLDYWVSRNHSETDATRVEVADHDLDDGSQTTLFVHAAIPGGAETRYYEVTGGGHTWPGGHEHAPALIVGRTSQDFSASEEIWSFLEHHQRKVPRSLAAPGWHGTLPQ